ncbi:hypothetical protein SAMN04487857_102367 [Pseudomonas sp. ok272]|uniref:hypothetical protein n=1 Tax=unclassified Pseudomonas TaxID=196821 RepID=UPI0008B1EDEA|nr:MULTISPECIES: hypothetical protein [unclassified Pseudomonas]SEM51063.1 hypothetical protein SAMN04487857_102367 [Pseudomonas sp. ok272]SFM22732.1 hypothetical protein SAMN04487858_101368 [Pseudomonas sp. ok602]
MISNLKSDIEFRREKALELSTQVRRHLAAGGKFTIGESPEINPEPAKRSEMIDPTTILKRRKPPITRAERNALRKLAEAL